MTCEHSIHGRPGAVCFKGADGSIVHLQFRQSLATAKTKIFDHVIAFDGRRIVSLRWSLRLCESNAAKDKHEADQNQRTHTTDAPSMRIWRVAYHVSEARP